MGKVEEGVYDSSQHKWVTFPYHQAQFGVTDGPRNVGFQQKCALAQGM